MCQAQGPSLAPQQRDYHPQFAHEKMKVDSHAASPRSHTAHAEVALIPSLRDSRALGLTKWLSGIKTCLRQQKLGPSPSPATNPIIENPKPSVSVFKSCPTYSSWGCCELHKTKNAGKCSENTKVLYTPWETCCCYILQIFNGRELIYDSDIPLP